MFIEKISIKNFGALVNYECSYSKGINLIEGPNESGKSTVGAFIKFIFFGLSALGGNGLSERKKYQSWEDDSASGSLEFECEGTKYKIERSIIPALNGQGREAVKTVNLSSGEELILDCEPGVYFFGVDGDVFTQSAYISQSAGVLVSANTVSRAIENMLFSGNELISTEEAAEKLEEAKNELLYKNKKGGKIYELSIERERLVKKAEEIRSGNADHFKCTAKLNASNTKLEEIKQEKANIESTLAAIEGGRVAEKFDDLHAKEEELAKALSERDAYIEEASHEGFVPENEYVAQIQMLSGERELYKTELEKAREDKTELGGNKMHDYDVELLEKAEAEGNAEGISEFFETNHKGMRFSATLGMFFTVFTLLWGALGAVCIFLPELSKIVLTGSITLREVGFVSAGVALIMLVLAVIFFIRSRLFSKKLDKKLDEYNATSEDDIYVELTAASSRANEQQIYLERLFAADSEIARIQGELDKRQYELDALCAKWGKDSSDTNALTQNAAQVISKIAQLAANVAEKESLCAVARALVEDKDEEGARAAFAKAENILSEQDEPTLSRKLDELSAVEKELYETVSNCEIRLAELSGRESELSSLADEIAVMSDKIERMTAHHNALALTLETLEKASRDLRAEVSPRLSMQASEYMRRATDDKYGSLNVSSDMNIKYGLSSGGAAYISREGDYLSAGTKDLAYVSLRLALVSFLYKKQLPPLVIDEAFSRLDDKRLYGVYSVIKDYAEHSGQVFVFTSQKRDGEILRKSSNVKYIRMSTVE